MSQDDFLFDFSCSLIVDFDIHVWDIRRPYIPYASFSEHKDVVTGTDSSVRDVKMPVCLYLL